MAARVEANAETRDAMEAAEAKGEGSIPDASPAFFDVDALMAYLEEG